jgi:hypothetical protein
LVRESSWARVSVASPHVTAGAFGAPAAEALINAPKDLASDMPLKVQ